MQRKRYSHEFKAEAVKFTERGEVSVAQVARDLGTRMKCFDAVGRRSAPSRTGLAAITPDEHTETDSKHGFPVYAN